MNQVYIVHYNGFTSWGTPYCERSAWRNIANARAELEKKCPAGQWKVINENRREYGDGSVAFVETLDLSDKEEGV